MWKDLSESVHLNEKVVTIKLIKKLTKLTAANNTDKSDTSSLLMSQNKYHKTHSMMTTLVIYIW